jgi:hypothetical protein
MSTTVAAGSRQNPQARTPTLLPIQGRGVSFYTVDVKVYVTCNTLTEVVMTSFVKDFEDSDPKTAISTNVYGYVTGTEVENTQCLRGLLRVLRVYTPRGSASAKAMADRGGGFATL